MLKVLLRELKVHKVVRDLKELKVLKVQLKVHKVVQDLKVTKELKELKV